jgi:hypothetical protein
LHDNLIHAHASQKDGGCGPLKRPKDIMNMQSASTQILPSTVLVPSTPDVSDISMDEDADAIGVTDDIDPIVNDAQAEDADGVGDVEPIITPPDVEGPCEAATMEDIVIKDTSIVVESTSSIASNADVSMNAPCALR